MSRNNPCSSLREHLNTMFEVLFSSPGLANHAKHLRAKSRLRPEQIEELYAGGYRDFQEGDFDRAAQRFEGAYALEPTNRRYLYAWGLALERAGKLDEAEGPYLMHSALAPDHAGGLFRLGLCVLQKKPRLALECLQEALKAADPNKEPILIKRIQEQLEVAQNIRE